MHVCYNFVDVLSLTAPYCRFETLLWRTIPLKNTKSHRLPAAWTWPFEFLCRFMYTEAYLQPLRRFLSLWQCAQRSLYGVRAARVQRTMVRLWRYPRQLVVKSANCCMCWGLCPLLWTRNRHLKQLMYDEGYILPSFSLLSFSPISCPLFSFAYSKTKRLLLQFASKAFIGFLDRISMPVRSLISRARTTRWLAARHVLIFCKIRSCSM